ncbi:MAG: diacylglycerol kinase family lipid kinase [Clostridiales bacterium]|jgi:YegS/Rv2252/BmrU family lipid kinase|nr:diacylglycerol kinase family lipid kinase [Clostridiales bacterium]
MVYLLWNPTAGKGRAAHVMPQIEKALRDRGCWYHIAPTEYPGHAQILAQEAVREGAEALIVAGGDGTLQEASSGLIGSNTPLAGIPLGNGNDFIRHLADLRHCRSEQERIAFCLETVFARKTRRLDVIKVSHLKHGAAHYALNIGNTGLDAEAADYATRLKKYVSSASYVISMIRCAFTHQPFRAAIEIDGKKQNHLLTLAAVCNGDRYGGGFIVSPSARVDDGYLNVCLVKHMTRLKILALFPLILMGGKYSRLREVENSLCRKILIDYEGPRKICLDGNIFTWEGPLCFEVLPKALSVLSLI